MKRFIIKSALHLHKSLTGRNVLKYLEEFNRNQWLSRDELLALQRAKLQRLMDYAYQFVPYYRRTFDEVGFKPWELQNDLSSLRKIPILTKSIIRENYKELLTTQPDRRRQMTKRSTSGSTGQPLVFMQDNDFRDSVTASIQHHMSWAGWKPGDLHAYIYGAPIKPTFREKVLIQMADWVWNRFQLNAFVMNEKSMTAFAERLLSQRPKILWCYATSLYQFAQFIRKSPYQGITFDGMFTSAEMLFEPTRAIIEETFRSKVFNRYGTVELGGIACECEEHTGLHVSVENNYVEILCDGHNAEQGEIGNIIITNLNNLGMPFIRYSVGDAGSWYAGENCPCGRASPLLSSIEGRLVDTFKTRDGHIVWSGFAGAAFRCLAHPSIKQFQVIQKSLDKMVVRLVQNGEITQSLLTEISLAIRGTFGENVAVEFEFNDEIPPLPSGKHQYSMSELNKPQPEEGKR